MALPAADAGLFYCALALAALSRDLHTRLHEEQGLADARHQGLVFAGIGGQDLGYRALIAQAGLPLQAVSVQQTAALNVAAAEIIPVEMFAFSAGRGDHAGIIASYK